MAFPGCSPYTGVGRAANALSSSMFPNKQRRPLPPTGMCVEAEAVKINPGQITPGRGPAPCGHMRRGQAGWGGVGNRQGKASHLKARQNKGGRSGQSPWAASTQQKPELIQRTWEKTPSASPGRATGLSLPGFGENSLHQGSPEPGLAGSLGLTGLIVVTRSVYDGDRIQNSQQTLAGEEAGRKPASSESFSWWSHRGPAASPLHGVETAGQVPWTREAGDSRPRVFTLKWLLNQRGNTRFKNNISGMLGYKAVIRTTKMKRHQITNS